MAQYKSFGQFFKRLENDIKKSGTQAMNRALVSARAQYSKSVGAETGIAAKKLRTRVRFIKASADFSDAYMSIGIRRLFPAQDLKVSKIRVDTRRGKRIGATFQTPTISPTFMPGAFITKGRSSGKRIVIQRTSAARYPTTTTVVDVFRKAVVNNYASIQKAMVDSFKKNFISNVSYNNSK